MHKFRQLASALRLGLILLRFATPVSSGRRASSTHKFHAGSFLRKRFAQEALPRLQRLLHEGPSRRNIIAPGALPLAGIGAC